MKTDKMPVVIVLLFFSWLIAISGVGLFTWNLFIFRFNDINLYGLLILLGSVFLAAIVRMFANIGQMIFDLKANNLKANDLKANTEKLVKIAGSLDKTGQDIREIKDFFEKIENRLDLKK